MYENKRTILGFDYGLISIGVAIGQELTSSARPLISLRSYEGIPNWNDIKLLLKQWPIQLFVVGIPLNMDGTKQEMTVAAKRFGNQLNGRFHLPIAWQDERLSTYAALKQLGINKKFQAKSSGDVDQVSAQLILQSWLNK